MLNERFDTVHSADGETLQARFDLSDEQLFAIAHAVDGVIADRYRGAALSASDALELRELVAIHDSALERAQDGYCGGTLIMTASRLGVTVQTLQHWLARCERIGFLHSQDANCAAVAEGALRELAELHVRALRRALGAADPALAP